MTTRIAVIADVHVPDVTCSAQEAALDHALNRLQIERPDVVLLIGDVTGSGSLESAELVRKKLDKSGLCFRVIPGNSDRRTLDNLAATTAKLTIDHPFRNGECAVCLLDMQDGRVSDRTKRYLQELTETTDHYPVVLASHYPIETCLQDPDIRSKVEQGKIALFVGAHCHQDREYRVGGMPAHTIRGLDPDKAIGGPPATALFKFQNREWRRSEIPFEEGSVAKWSSSMRQEFIENLGFSCMTESLKGLNYASRYSVACVELRAANALALPRGELLRAVQNWRDSGGRYLSMHMPNLGYEDEKSPAIGVEVFREAVSLASVLQAEHILVHVPRVSLGLLQPNGELWTSGIKLFLQLLEEPMERGTVIGIENLHMNPGEHADSSRGFGYLPSECYGWVESLRTTSGYSRIGILLDIGHARNNLPFSKTCSLGQWYALLGKEIVGYHLHQVTLLDGVMCNHYPITNVYGPLVSLSSFFWGWKNDRLSHAPMFLEIRGKRFEDTVASMEHIRQYIRGESSS